MTFRLGTSSWTAKGWVGSFYPEGTPTEEFLPCYAREFDCVEADTTYYRVPAARVVENWGARTPAGFQIAAKFPRGVVHAGKGPKPDPSKVLVIPEVEDEVDLFLRRMALLGEKCGPLVLQFPYFNKSVFPDPMEFFRRLEDFLDLLPSGFRYAVEVRNKNYVGPELLRILQAHGVAFVLLDLNYMPHPDTWVETLPLQTADFLVARLIGDRKAMDELTDTFDRTYLDRWEQLQRWARLLRRLAADVPDAYVFANNHFAGHAPDTLRALQPLLAEP